MLKESTFVQTWEISAYSISPVIISKKSVRSWNEQNVLQDEQGEKINWSHIRPNFIWPVSAVIICPVLKFYLWLNNRCVRITYHNIKHLGIFTFYATMMVDLAKFRCQPGHQCFLFMYKEYSFSTIFFQSI